MSADNPNNTDRPAPPPPINAFDPANPIPGQAIDANGGKFYYLGDNPTTGAPLWSSFVSAKSGAIVINGRLVDPETGTVIADFSSASGGGGLSPTSVYSEQQANARNAAGLAEQSRQFDQTNAYNHAVNDQQYALKQGDLLGNINGTQTENGRQFDQNQALNYYKYLSDTATNPRNFVQTLFNLRGAPAPAGSEQFGNVNALQRFNAPQLRIQGQPVGGFRPPVVNTTATGGYGSPTGTGAYNAQSQGASRVSQALGPGVSFASGNLAGFDKSGMPITTAAPTQLGGNVPLLPGQTEDPTFQAFRQNVAQNALGGNVSQEQAMHPKDVGPNGLAVYKNGGVLTETVVGHGVQTGRPYVFNENPAHPEGVVPAASLPHFLQKRHGQVVGGHNAYAVGGVIGDPYTGTPSSDPHYPPTNPYSGGGAALDPGLQTGTYAGPGGAQAPAPFFQPGPANPYQQPSSSAGPTMLPDTSTSPGVYMPNPIDATNAFNQQPQRTSTLSTPLPYIAPATPQTPLTPVDGTGSSTNQFGAGGLIGAGGATGGTGGGASQVQQPLSTPQASNNFNASVPAVSSGPTPAAVSPAGTFGAPSGNLPQFLSGEDNGGTIGQLISSGYLPPFLSRTLAQAHGIQSQGTNQPQPFDLPGGLPLVSQLGASQMTPSEKAAFESIISSYGIDPQDYWAYVSSLSPQGGQSSFGPSFGNSFSFARQ